MIKDIIEENEKAKGKRRELELLHRDFPQCFNNEGKFDIEKFKELAGVETEMTAEGYDLNFLGKNYARLLASTDTTTVIKPDTEENEKAENKDSENIYISGDNLDVLKHLLKSYAGEIKCIYIDPPYNTGSDGFVYNDKFNFSTADLQKKLSIDADKAERLLKMTKRGSASHSAWLTFMLPRLMLAHGLLKEEGVIFISIDDNEQANLKLLCDSVFGEENFVVEFPRVTKKGGKSSAEVARNHDYVLMYVKNNEKADLIGVAHTDSGYREKDEYFEERGFYKLNQTLDYDSLGYVPTLDYPITINGTIFYAGGSKEEYDKRQAGQHGRADWGWRWSKDLYEFGSRNGFVVVKGSRIYTKTYQNAKIVKKDNGYAIEIIDRTKPLSTLVFSENQYSNDNAKKSIESLFGKGIFEYTKPPILIQDLQKLVNGNDYTVLDFFSGSATTAHAVMKLNSEDGGNRKYIMVQLPEKVKKDSEAEKAGYKTIDEIGQERIRRAAKKIKGEMQTEIDAMKEKLEKKEVKPEEERQQGKLFEEGDKAKEEIKELKRQIAEKEERLRTQDRGFKHYTLVEPKQNTLDKMEEFDPNGLIADDNLMNEFGKETVLETWKVKDGYGLNAKVEAVRLDKYTAYLCGNHLYFVDAGLTENDVVKLVEKYGNELTFNVDNWVLFGYSFTFSQTEMLKKNAMPLEDVAKNKKVNIQIRY